jgi:hypothetical protein
MLEVQRQLGLASRDKLKTTETERLWLCLKREGTDAMSCLGRAWTMTRVAFPRDDWEQRREGVASFHVGPFDL